MQRPVDVERPDQPIAAIGSDDALATDLRREVAQLREALLSRQQIGVATGLVAQRFDCSPDRAWSILVRISQDLNVKVREIAAVLGRAQAGEIQPADAELLTKMADHLPGTAWVRVQRSPVVEGRLGPVDLQGAWIDGAGVDSAGLESAFRAETGG